MPDDRIPLTFKVETSPTATVETTNTVAVPPVDVPVVPAPDPLPATPVVPNAPAETVPDKPLAESVKATLDSFDPPKKVSVIKVAMIAAALFGLTFAGLHYKDSAVDWVKNIGSYVSKPSVPDKVPVAAPQKPKEADDEFIKLPPSLQEKRAPAGILEARDYYLRLLNDDQTVTVRTGGSRSWRLQNPCSILWGKFAQEAGANGGADKNSEGKKFAVWMKYEEGRKACYKLLFESDKGYMGLSVQDAMKRFAPDNQGFKTSKYLAAISRAKIPLPNTMSNLSEERRQKLIDVIMDVEDFQPGKVWEYDNVKDFAKRGY